ncbi:flippase-like domain-containing protein [bacterium]|nr:flippase-like domain-containing protein [bacterium]RQV92071.1 MAG: UPF0104 family protein [bacterium]
MISRENGLIRRVLFQAFKIIISGILIGYLLRRIGMGNVIEHLQSADVSWLCGATVLFTASLFIGSCQWWILLKSEGIEINWKKTVSFYFVGLFFNNFLISGLGGDLFRMIDIKRYSKNGTSAVSSVFLDRFMGLFVLSGMAVFAIPWILIRGGSLFQLWFPLVFLTAGWILILLFLFNSAFAGLLKRLLQKITPKKISAHVQEIYQKIWQFGRKRHLLIQVGILSIIIQSARIMTHYCLGRSLGIMLSPLYFFLLIPLIAVMASLPVSVGGLGIREQSGVVLFGLLGVHTIQAFTMEALAYLFAVVLSLPGGLIFMVRKKVGR